MKVKNLLIEFMMSFFIVTACVTILEGVVGMLFLEDVKFGFEAFLSPPLFGFLTSLLGFITYSSKELTIKQALFRKAIHLSLIEALVFGLNAWVGNFYEPKLVIALILAIAVIYITVNFVLWVNDQKSAEQFNENLRVFQEKQSGNRK